MRTRLHVLLSPSPPGALGSGLGGRAGAIRLSGGVRFGRRMSARGLRRVRVRRRLAAALGIVAGVLLVMGARLCRRVRGAGCAAALGLVAGVAPVLAARLRRRVRGAGCATALGLVAGAVVIL